MTVGVTATVLVVTLPALELQVYVLAPDAVMVAVDPIQMVGELTVTVGVVFTVALTVPEFVQPAALVAFSVNV